MSIFTLSKFSADTVRERAEYFERESDALASFYLGRASKHLAVEGKPAKGHYDALMCGYSPVSGESLLSDHRRKCLLSPRSVIGFSTSIGLHKSLSVLYAGLCQDDQKLFLDALIAASRGLFTELEGISFFGSRTGRGGSGCIKGEAIALAYVHCTNRALEPHLHIHVEIPNICRCADGQWRTLAAAALYDRQAEVARLFDKHLIAELGARLSWLQSRFWSDERGISIPSIPAEVQDAASTRRKEVIEALANGAESKVEAAYATRQQKVDISLADLVEAWRDQFGSVVQALRG